ncbi:MAG: type II toxin-antitoxin system RelE/ParE family toxin [Chitinophagaceae bacterium]|nr:type II toxin-antitoxin system RelE/ParE family toxin [Chitinophagaceae bacterium]
MENRFEVVFLAEAFRFLKSVNTKHAEKILFNIRRAQQDHDPELLKKINSEIWEFRTHYQGLQYRLFAFWDKTNSSETLVIATHGIIKKQWKVADKEIAKAMAIRKKYFLDKSKK